MRSSIAFAGALGVSILSAQSFALDVRLGLVNESTHTDNAQRAPDNVEPIEEWVHQPGAELFVEHQSDRLVLSGNYEYERRIRSEDQFADDSVLVGTSELTWHAIPGRLDFEVSNSRTETTEDAQVAQNPDNQQVSSTTRLGPTLRFRVRDVDEVQLQFLYTDDHNEVDETDTTRETLSASYVWNLNNNNRVTFSALANQVDFENTAAPDYDGYTSAVTWERFGPNIDFRGVAGYTTIERELNRDDVSVVNGELEVTWRMTPTMSLTLEGAHDLRDRSQTLTIGALDFGTNAQIDSNLNEVFINTRGALTWNMRLWENLFRVGISYDDEDYEDILNDVQRVGGQVRFERRLSPRFDIILAGFYGDEEFLDENLRFDRRTYEFALRYNVNRRLNMRFMASRDERTSDTDPATDYEENSYGVSIQYLLLE